MANGYINIAHLYKRMPVLTDTNGDYLIAVSDLRTAIAMAAAETGDVVAQRAEVAREIFEELDKKIFHHIPDLYTFEIYTELKKKYTATTDEPPKGE